MRSRRTGPAMRYISGRIAPLAAACGLALPASAAPAAPHWSFTDLGTIGGLSTYGGPINALGQVAGSYDLNPAGSLWHGWTTSPGGLIDIGTLGGSTSDVAGLNVAGQLVGTSDLAGDNSFHAFVYSNGAMRDLGTLGGNYSAATGINASGQIVGISYTAGNSASRAFVYGNGTMVDLGTLGGSGSSAYGINDAGQITGSASTAAKLSHAFLYTSGHMSDLGTLGGSSSRGQAVNAAGQVAGWAQTAVNDQHAFLYAHGAMTDLGTLGGSASFATGLNAAMQVVGYADVAGGSQHAFLYGGGKLLDLNTVGGVAGGGLVLTYAGGINDSGQISGTAVDAAGISHAYILKADSSVWAAEGSGRWDDVANWSYGVAPQRLAVFIDPARSLTVTGPAGQFGVATLTIGGDAGGNNGIATLNLGGGVIDVLGSAGRYTTVTAKGVLTGDGTINGLVTNLGTVTAQSLSLTGGLLNQGRLGGNGRINTDLTNALGGLLQVTAGQTFTLGGLQHRNAGSVEVTAGGNLFVDGAFQNQSGGQLNAFSSTLHFKDRVSNDAGASLYLGGSMAAFHGGVANGGRLSLDNSYASFDGPSSNTGQINLNQGTLAFGNGLLNTGLVNVGFGGAQVYGGVVDASGGRIILSGNSETAFYDPLEVQKGGELRVSAGSTAVFFGLVQQRTGALFSGAGQSFYEGGLQIGNSPGLGANAGSVAFGAGNVYEAEIGGTASGDAQGNGIAFDRYTVAGTLTFGGTLKLVSWNGFTGQAGQSVDLFDWGRASGSFDTIDASGLQLAANTRLDLSRLYVDGVVAVQAVPEPGAWAMWLAGLGIVGVMRRRLGTDAAGSSTRIGRTLQ